VFNQTTADTSSFAHFTQAVQELNFAAYRATGLPSLGVVKELIYGQRRANVIPIGVLHYQYNLLDTLATYDGRLSPQDRRAVLYDVPGRTQSPYLSRTTLVPSVLAIEVPVGTSTFSLPNSLQFDNTGNVVTRIDIDFGDGLVTRPLGGTFTASLPTTGVRYIHFVTYLSDGSQTSSYSAVLVTDATAAGGVVLNGQTPGKNPTGVPMSSVTTIDTRPCFDAVALNNVLPFRDYLGVTRAGKGDVSYYYSDCAKQTDVVKPVILLDGIDFIKPGTGLDTRDGRGVYSQLGYNNNGERNLGLDLRQAGFDILVLNFPGVGGADFIERNAFVLVALIQKTNRTLRATALATGKPLEKLVVIGPSMSGLVSRYALTYMEKQYNGASNPATYRQPDWDHNTRLWVSFDSPQLGANIPLGAQRYIRFYSQVLEVASATANLEQFPSHCT